MDFPSFSFRGSSDEGKFSAPHAKDTSSGRRILDMMAGKVVLKARVNSDWMEGSARRRLRREGMEGMLWMIMLFNSEGRVCQWICWRWIREG